MQSEGERVGEVGGEYGPACIPGPALAAAEGDGDDGQEEDAEDDFVDGVADLEEVDVAGEAGLGCGSGGGAEACKGGESALVVGGDPVSQVGGEVGDGGEDGEGPDGEQSDPGGFGGFCGDAGVGGWAGG